MTKTNGKPGERASPSRVSFRVTPEVAEAIRQLREQAGDPHVDVIRDALSMTHVLVNSEDLAILQAIMSAEGTTQSTATRPDVFLCHSGEDKAFVRRLADDLDKLGIHAWLDEWEIGPGDSLLDKIGTGINSAKWFCVVLSKASLRSKWCRTELAEALYNETMGTRRKIIPIKYEDVAVPPFVKGKRHIKFDPAYYSGLLELACAIRGISPRVASTHIAKSAPESLDAVITIVERHRKEWVHRFGARDWRALGRLLAKRGIRDLSDEIEIRDRLTGEIFLAS